MNIGILRNRKRSIVTACNGRYSVALFMRKIMPVMFLVAYAFLGALLFQFLESSEEKAREERKRNESIFRHEILVEQLMEAHISCHSTNNCRSLFDDIVRYHNPNMISLNSTNQFRWDFGNSLIFAGTIFTTIGCGNMYCQTRWGQLATIVYAVVGIPLVMTVLMDIGRLFVYHATRNWNRLRRLVNYVRIWLRNRLHLLQKGHQGAPESASNSIENYPETEFPVFLGFLVVLAYIFLSAWIISCFEKQWDFFTCFYYIFIILSTIGLGDLVPNDTRPALLAFVLVIIGLSLVSMCIGMMQKHAEDKYAKVIQDLEERLALMNQLNLSNSVHRLSDNAKRKFSIRKNRRLRNDGSADASEEALQNRDQMIVRAEATSNDSANQV